MMKILFSILIFSLSFSQVKDSLKLYLNNEDKIVQFVWIDSTKFVSCNSLAEVLSKDFVFNPIIKKGNFWINNLRMQFTAESEFFTLFDTTNNKFALEHLQFPIKYIDSTLYVELNSVLKVLYKNAKIDLKQNITLTKEQVIATKLDLKDDKKSFARKRLEEMRKLEEEKRKWLLDVIVIDPGHGGHDPGSIGVNGTYEKDITLGIAAKLGRLIKQKLPEVEVVFTRTGDNFVELYKRGKFANDAKGKLFISIHCNSHDVKPSSPKGFEIYLLRPGKTAAAIRVAEKENAVIDLEEDTKSRYQKITEENFIILTMAQNGYMKQSEQFAEILEKEMAKKMETDSRGVKQAGFYVLVGASMPNVLIESGYLSNMSEEKFLYSQEGQQQIAKSIFESIRLYKVFYENQMSGEI